MIAILALLQLLPAAPAIDGSRLFIGDSCYITSTLAGGSSPVGEVLRRVERIGRDRIRIRIASRFNGGPLLTSTLILTRGDLQPIEARDETDGRTQLLVRYGRGTARGRIYRDAGPTVTATRPFDPPAWDDESLDFVVAALPLAEGAHFAIPIFHFDRGPATARVDVSGSRSVESGGADRDAWVVTVRTRSDMTITFLVDKADRRLREIDVGDVRSYLGGDCSEVRG